MRYRRVRLGLVVARGKILQNTACYCSVTDMLRVWRLRKTLVFFVFSSLNYAVR